MRKGSNNKYNPLNKEEPQTDLAKYNQMRSELAKQGFDMEKNMTIDELMHLSNEKRIRPDDQ